MNMLKRFFRYIKGILAPPPIPPGRICDDCNEELATYAISKNHMLCERCKRESMVSGP
jgi:hypothetical protein